MKIEFCSVYSLQLAVLGCLERKCWQISTTVCKPSFKGQHQSQFGWIHGLEITKIYTHLLTFVSCLSHNLCALRHSFGYYSHWVGFEICSIWTIETESKQLILKQMFGDHNKIFQSCCSISCLFF